MSTIGPTLPPHLLPKRKCVEEDDDKAQGKSRSSSVSSKEGDKRRRILGPAPPPAPLEERPTTGPDRDKSSDSESDDDYGPAPPPAVGSADYEVEARRQKDFTEELALNEATKKPQREEWMLAPPSHDDWSSRIDPTKLRNRKFNSGKGAKAPPQGGSKDSSLWTETPEEKRKRLEDEVMGVKKPAQLDEGSKKSARGEAEAKETERRIREYNEKNRHTSLYAEHKKTEPEQKEDDPSKRAFDKEKDIGGGMKIGHAKRKELLTKAADFNSRFAKGSYL